jgi:low affinity Fe/Cu permease
MAAVLVVAVWAITGPLFGFSDTWQLVINTGTTIVTFLMVFLIQNTQNRESAAVQLKLDELIRSSRAPTMHCWIWNNSARTIWGGCGRSMKSWPRPRARI